MADLKFLRTKRAKGRIYYYFDTGQLSHCGKPLLTRLPDKRDLAFGGAYARALAARTNRANRRAYLSFDELKRRYERSPEYARLAENSKRSYDRYLEVASRLLRAQNGGSPPAAQIETRDIHQLREKLADRPGAANATIRAVGALFAWGSDPAQALVPGNPASRVKKFDGGEHEPWPEALIEEALDDPAARLPVALLYFLGQRIGDTVKMGRQSLQADCVAVIQQKTGTPLLIKIHRRLAAIIAADAPKDALAFLVDERGKALSAGAVRQRIQAWAKTRGHHVVPHGLRKNSVNALLEAGCSTAEVSAITGQDLKTIEHYAKKRNQERLGRSAILKFERRNGTGK